MTGHERVLAALDRRPGAELPLDLCGSTVTGISDDALARLLAARGLPSGRRPVDSVQGISAPTPEVLAALGSDTLRIGSDRIRPTALPDGGSEAIDRFGVAWRRGPGQLYFSQISAPLGEGSLSEALDRYAFPEPDREALRSAAAEGRRAAQAWGLFPILDRDCAGIFEMSARLRGAERFYVDLYDDPEGAARLADALLAYKAAYWDAAIGAWEEAGGGGSFAAAEADDYGTESSLLASPGLLRAEYIARYATLIARIKGRAPGARVVFHSCGAVRPLIADLIGAGVDALNPVQRSAAGMELEALKRDFGDRLAFWGGSVDTKRTLPAGSPAEVRAEVLEAARILGAGGGHVAATVHNIQADVPTENVLAFLDAVAEARERGVGA